MLDGFDPAKWAILAIAAAGAIYGYGTLNSRVETLERMVENRLSTNTDTLVKLTEIGVRLGSLEQEVLRLRQDLGQMRDGVHRYGDGIPVPHPPRR